MRADQGRREYLAVGLPGGIPEDLERKAGPLGQVHAHEGAGAEARKRPVGCKTARHDRRHRLRALHAGREKIKKTMKINDRSTHVWRNAFELLSASSSVLLLKLVRITQSTIVAKYFETIRGTIF